MTTHYLDWAASAIPDKDILLSSARNALELHANPSAGYGPGRAARASLENSRKSMSETLGTGHGSLIFTSGGTESDTIPLGSLLAGQGNPSLVISGIEHAAIDAQATRLERLGIRTTRIRPEPDGCVDPQKVADAVCKDTVMVAVMTVNNETGAIQPVDRIVNLVRQAAGRRQVWIHSDAVQALGKLPFNPAGLGLDSAAFSAHKLGGPRGVGALWMRKPLSPFAVGGGQESGQRPGTENVAGAHAFAESSGKATESLEKHIVQALELERILLEGLASIPGARVLPEGRMPGDRRYSPYIVSIAFPGLSGQAMVRILDEAGVYVSEGSACSGPGASRRVLEAMGVDAALARCSVRVSTGYTSTEADIAAFLEHAARAYARYA